MKEEPEETYGFDKYDEEEKDYSPQPVLKGRAKSGVDRNLEDQADQILKEYRKGVKKLSDMHDFFTESQWEGRLSKEVFVSSGTPEKHLYSGVFSRTYNKKAGERKRLRSETVV